jgi:hypothetical protein
MPQEGRHNLELFIKRTFGDQMGAILLAGYGSEVGLREASQGVLGAAEGGGEEIWVIEISGNLPHGEEPLVLAALLKLLLSKGPLGVRFDFAVEDVLAELGWQDRRFARDAVDNAVRKYTGLSYTRKREVGAEARGMYTLVTGYDQITGGVTEGGRRTRVLDRVHFHPRFIEGLRSFRITFAGLDFGSLHSVEYYGMETDSVM